MNKLFAFDDYNKRFFSILLSLCIPIIIQNLISSSVNVIDTVMISSLGEVSVASVGVANQFFFIFNMCLAGVLGGSGLFISQFFGKNDITNIKKVTALSILLGLVMSLPFVIIAFVSPESIIHIFSYDPEVVSLCRNYFKIVVISYPLTAISMGFGVCSRSIKNPNIGMKCSAIAIVVNVCLNYALIFGKLGFPKMGVEGAALATLIARLMEAIIMVWYVYLYKKDYMLRFNIHHFGMFEKDFLVAYGSKSFPIFLNESFWAVATVCYSVAYAMAGTSAIAASQIATTTSNFFVITAMCIAMGSSIMLGNELGSDHIDRALDYSKKLGVIVTVTGFLMGILLIISIPMLLKVFSVSETLAPDITKIFIIMAIVMALRAFNTFIIIGILRSGGDTKMALIIEMGSMWLGSVPLTFLAAKLGLPIYLLVRCTSVEEIIKFIFGVPRALSKKWAVNIVKDL